jgi:LacI family transcriptional regulator
MPSITDVAKRANVSITTVSRVMSGSSHPVNEETRARVIKAAKELNYSPSALAKAMVTRDTRIVGVIIGDAIDPYFAAIVRGVEDVAREHGYLVIVCNSDRVPEIETKYLSTLHDYRVDGVIFAGGGLTNAEYLKEVNEKLESFQSRGASVVTLSEHLFPSLQVVVDNELAVRDAAEYLFELNHQRVAYISGPDNLKTSELRLNGYRAALEARGLALDPNYVLPGKYTYESGQAVVEHFIKLENQPTAIVASNDLMAIGCIVGLKQAGYRIPHDVSVIGIDNITPAEFVDPPLTTIGLPLYEQGATGMEYLVKLRNEEVPPDKTIVLPHELVIRGSTGRLSS